MKSPPVEADEKSLVKQNANQKFFWLIKNDFRCYSRTIGVLLNAFLLHFCFLFTVHHAINFPSDFGFLIEDEEFNRFTVRIATVAVCLFFCSMIFYIPLLFMFFYWGIRKVNFLIKLFK